LEDKINIVSPHCIAANRISPGKLGDKPICGKYKKSFFVGKPVELNDFNFAEFSSHTNIPVVADFWAEWCGPCKMMSPIFEQATSRLEPNVRFVKVDTEAARNISVELRIRSIPTIAILKNVRVVTKQAGDLSLNDLMNWVKQNI
jgi:thioredoxin 2